MALGIVLSPRPVVAPLAVARPSLPERAQQLRSGSLAGLKIGIRRDQHWRSWDWVSDRWADALRERGAELTVWRAASQLGKEAVESERQLDEFIASVDVAVFGMANCGGCTMETVRDAQRCAQHGVPTVVVSTAQFVNLAKQLAARSGWADLPVEVLPYPLEPLPRDQVEQVADEHLTSLLELLADAS